MAVAKTKKEAVAQDYIVQWELVYTDKTYQAGERISLSQDEAQPLLLCGVIEAPEKET